MSSDTLLNTEMKNSILKSQYINYTNILIKFEEHINKLYTDMVININDRNSGLKIIDTLVKDMIKIYNITLIQNHKDTSIIVSSIDNIITQCSKTQSKLINIKNIFDKDAEKYKPFGLIKDQLIILSEKYGFFSIESFLKMYLDEHYDFLINYKDSIYHNIYNDVFVPHTIKIINKSPNSITSMENNCDCLLDDMCCITIELMKNSICFQGYIKTGPLNILIRISQIYNKYIFEIKNNVKQSILSENPNFNMMFLFKYIKMSNCKMFFINSPEQICKKIILDKKYFNELTKKKINDLMKDFLTSDIKQMYRMIFLLSMGNYNDISNGTMLFSLLNERKIESENVAKIIHNNMSFATQNKLIISDKNIKSELSKLKNTINDPIQKDKILLSNPNLPIQVRQYIIEKMNESKYSVDKQKNQIAIDGLINFPWKSENENKYSSKNSITKSKLLLSNICQKLNNVIYGHQKTKQSLIELVGKWIQNPQSTGQVIGLVGPPGCGKTLMAKSISEALNLPMGVIGLGGINDSSDLLGHSFTYVNSQYGMIVRQMIKVGKWRCVLFFDEVDKTASRSNVNEIFNVLIHITDPNMNKNFQDRFYSSSIDFDLSGALIIFSYNDSTKLSPILLDRIKEIKISPYSLLDKINIVQNHILPELCTDIGLNHTKIQINENSLTTIIDNYTSEAGVRELKRKLEEILLKLNIDKFHMSGPFSEIVTKYVQDEKTINKIFKMENDDVIVIDDALIYKYLNFPLIISEIDTNDMIGVVNGLYATEMGLGGLVPIQIRKNHLGKINDFSHLELKITGNQKKVMREAVNCALTASIHIFNEDIQKSIHNTFPNGFHIHTPQGSTPKNGCSAGCAMAIAFISIILNKKINCKIAITGEIDLVGRITRIGSLQLKLIGAKKMGITTVFIPLSNKDEYEKIIEDNPELSTLTVKPVNHIIEIARDPSVIFDINESVFDQSIINVNTLR